MNTQARRKRKEELLHAEGFCSVSSLAKQLDVSEVTIRNDLSSLEDEGKVTRIHGGAMLAMDRARGESFEERSTINQDKKLWIARQAATLVDNYDSLILDASTTAFYMADYLKKYRGLTVFTNGIEVAFRLAENRSNKVVLTGGLLRPETASLTGQFGNDVLGGVHINKAFLSCTGWSPTLDLMDAAGRINDIAVVAQNATENARIEIRKPGSRFIGSTAYFPEKYGFKIIPAMLRLIQHQPVPPAIYVDHVFITKDNVDEYYPQG